MTNFLDLPTNEFEHVESVFSESELRHMHTVYEGIVSASAPKVLESLVEAYDWAVSAGSPILAKFYVYNYLLILCNIKPEHYKYSSRDTDLYRYCNNDLFNVGNEREYNVRLLCESKDDLATFHYYQQALENKRKRQVYDLGYYRLFDLVSYYRHLSIYDPAKVLVPKLTDVRIRHTDYKDFDIKVVLYKTTVRNCLQSRLKETLKVSLELSAGKDDTLTVDKCLLTTLDRDKYTRYAYLTEDESVRLSADAVINERKDTATMEINLEFEDPNVAIVDVYRHLVAVLDRKAKN